MLSPGELDEDEDHDPEADEFLADTLAAAVVAGVVKGVNKNLGKRRPPERSKPYPKCTDWAAEGLSYRLEKLMGRRGLGPNAKLALGFGGIIVTMMLNAEPIPPSEMPYYPAAPPAPPRAPQNGAQHAPAVSRELVKQEVAAAMRDDTPAAAAPTGDPAATAATGTFRKGSN